MLKARIGEPAGPLFRSLHLRLDRPAAVVVDYWTANAPRLRVRAEATDASAVVGLGRLRAGRTYRYQVRVIGTDGSPEPAFVGEFRTDTLPEDLAAISLTAAGAPSAPMALLLLSSPGGFQGYVAVNGTGAIVWYYRTVDLPFGIARRPDGNFIAMDKGRGLLELTPAGDVLRELAQDELDRNMHHDAIVTPANTVLFLAQDRRAYGDRTIVGEAIWEWDPETGEAVKRWSAHDFLDPAVDRTPQSTDGDWLHANALAIGSQGNILISLRRLNQVMSIAPGWNAIEWRLGGPGATITLAEGEPFTGQHTVAEVGPNRILLFDNRHELGGYSRAVEFELSDGQARQVWEWRPERDNFAFAVSSARRLPNGNTLVGFGMSSGLNGSTGPIEVYEVTREGLVIWHLLVEGPRIMYRAEPLETIAGEAIANPS
ncbi:MAG TPA: aryl-sulfate sulfotransferase [Longimicrobiales bacterium]